MSKKETTTGEEFESFLNFAIKYKVKPKKQNINTIVKRVRTELGVVAKEMNLPIEDKKVAVEWCKRGGRFNDEIFVNLIAPLYFPAPKWKIVWNEELGLHTAILNI